MKKIFSTNLLIIPALLSGSTAVTLMASPITKQDIKEGTDVPTDFLEINSGVLQGFKSDVKPDMLQGYTQLSIPTGVTSVARYAFANMFDRFSTQISKIIFPTTLTEIGDGAFMNCNGYNDQMVIDFTTCTNLTVINNEAFYGCHLNKQLPLNLSNCPLTTIGNSAFRFAECTSLSLPSSLKNVGLGAFYSSYNVSEFDLSNFSSIPSWMYKENMIFTFMGSKSETSERTIKLNVSNNTPSEWQDVLTRQGINFDQETKTFFKISYNRVTTVDDFEYEKDGDTYKITKFISDPSNYDILSIPSQTKDGGIVTKIKQNAFKDVFTSQLIHLEISQDSPLTEIEQGAFSGCKSIQGDLIFPKEMTTIGNEAFYGCSGLNGTIDFSKTQMDTFKQKAFSNCTNVNRVIFPNKEILNFEKASFANDINLSIIDYSPMRSQFAIVFKEDSTNSDTDLPFYNICSSGFIYGEPSLLTNIVQQMGTIWKFTDHDVGTDYKFKWLVKSQGATAEQIQTSDFVLLNNCYLKSLKPDWINKKIYLINNFSIPKSILGIENNAFDKIFSKNKDNANWKLNFNNGLEKIGDFAFANGNMLVDNIKLPNTLKTIGVGAFLNCSQLRGALSMPKNLTTISAQAFFGCCNLSSINLSSSIKNIGSFAFANTELKKITFGNNVQGEEITLDSCVFSGANSLSELDFSNFYDYSLISGKSDSFKMGKVKGKVYVKDNVDFWKIHLSKFGMNVVDSESEDGWYVTIKS